jgi:hypothetical protein
MEIKNLIADIENGRLPKRDWNHYTHLLLALYHLFNDSSEYDAIAKIRCTLIRYGTLISDEFICPIKYHETLTRFWISEMKKFIDGNKEKTFEELDAAMQTSALFSKDYIFNFYTKEILDSSEARATFVPY